MDIQPILTELKKPFPATDHRERQLPGGGKWFFIPWRKIRDRLDQVYPEWTCTYSSPSIAGDYVVIRCQITIAGITREGVGNDLAYPEKQTYGTPIERATANAFKAAAEQFGVGAYLGDQRFVVQYLRSQGDDRRMRANQPGQRSQPSPKKTYATPRTSGV